MSWGTAPRGALRKAVVVEFGLSGIPFPQKPHDDHERGRMLNCLKITGLKLGLILNVRRAKLEWQGIVLERDGLIRRGALHWR
jgi:hypothetical protein